MVICLAAGYAICIMNIVFIAESECKTTDYGRLGGANTIIFLVVATFVLVFAHTIIWLPTCTAFCKKSNLDKVAASVDNQLQ